MEQQTLTAEQSFEVIFKLTSSLTLNRQDHAIMDSALRTLAGLIQPAEQEQPTA